MAVVVPILTEFKSKGLDEAQSKIGKFGKSAGASLKKVGIAAGLAAAAFAGAAVVFAKKAIVAGEAAATSNARIEQINESMGLFGEQATNVSKRLIKLAEATARNTGVDQNQIKLTQAKLLTFANLAKTADKVGGAFDRATKAAVDMAAAGFGDAAANAVQLGKALNDPIKGITALSRSGITFTEQEKEKIKTLVESNKTLEAQQMILEAIEAQVGGTAEATANDTDKMKVAYSQLMEQVGMLLLPVLNKFVNFMVDKIVPAVEKVIAIFEEEGLAGVLSRLGDWIKQAAPIALQALVDLGKKLFDWLINTGLPALQKKLGQLKDALTAWIKESGPDTLKNLGKLMGDLVKWILSDGIPLLIETTAKLAVALTKWLIDIGPSLLKGIAAYFVELGKGLAAGFVELGKKFAAWGADLGEELIQGVLDQAKKLPGRLAKGGFSGLMDITTGFAGKLFKGITPFADGGIVTRPTLGLVGEAGPEAIIPLNRASSSMTTSNVTINVHGGDPQAVVDALRRYNLTNGPLPITVAA